MLTSLTRGEGPARFTSSAEETLRQSALISCYHLAFTGPLQWSIQLLHITGEDESRGFMKERKKLSRKER